MARDAKGHWIAGSSGNPSGRPKANRDLQEAALEAGQAVLEDGRTKNQAVSDKMYQLAMEGNVQAAQWITKAHSGVDAGAILGELTFEQYIDQYIGKGDEVEP